MKRILVFLLLFGFGAFGAHAQPADTEFVEAHSWQFDNFLTFDDLPWASNLSWELYRDTFIGIPPTRSVAGSGFDVLFYDQIFSQTLTEPGNCFGMILLSYLIEKKGHHLGLCAPVRQYGGDNTREDVDLDGDGNTDGSFTRGPDSDRVQRAINRMHGHQINLPTLRHLMDVLQQQSNRDGNFAFGQAKQYIGREGATPISVTRSLSPQDGGHALLAYETRQQGNTREILVYDPNRPWAVDSTWYRNGNNVITVDIASGRWEFDMQGWVAGVEGTPAALEGNSNYEDGWMAAVEGTGNYYVLDTSQSTASGNDLPWNPDGSGGNEGVWVHQGTQAFDTAVDSLVNLTTAGGATNGEIYVVRDRGGIYFELDTSQTSGAFNDVVWDPDGDGTADGLWVRQGKANFDPNIWWGEPGGGGGGTVDYALGDVLGADDQQGGNLVVIPASVTAPKARGLGSMGISASSLLNTIIIYGEGASLQQASSPGGDLHNALPWYPSDAPPDGEKYDFAVYVVMGEPPETIDLAVESGPEGYRVDLVGRNGRVELESDEAAGTDLLSIDNLGSLRPGLSLQSASGAPYRVAFHQRGPGVGGTPRAMVVPELRAPAEAPVRMAIGDDAPGTFSLQSPEAALEYTLELRQGVGDEAQVVRRDGLQLPAGQQQIIQPGPWDDLRPETLQIRELRIPQLKAPTIPTVRDDNR